MMPLVSSFVVVALAEMGDKTQLIALTLGLRCRRPWTVMLGILMATVLNHALASAVGAWGGAHVEAALLGWLLGLSFLAFGVWTLVPDRAETPVLHLACSSLMAWPCSPVPASRTASRCACSAALPLRSSSCSGLRRERLA